MQDTDIHTSLRAAPERVTEPLKNREVRWLKTREESGQRVWFPRRGLGEAIWLEEQKSHFYTDQQAGGGQLYTRDRNKKTTNSSEHSEENGSEVVRHAVLDSFHYLG